MKCQQILTRTFCSLAAIATFSMAGLASADDDPYADEKVTHELLEQGFEVAVIKDATAAAQIPEGDGYLAALINFRFMANAVWTTDEAVGRLGGRTAYNN